MPNNKTPGNDGLSKEFYETWDEIKDVFLNSVKETKEIDSLSVSQRQAIIKLLQKKDRYKRYIKNWRQISLLNVDTQKICKAFAENLKEALASIISQIQRAYVKNRCISENSRMIADIN